MTIFESKPAKFLGSVLLCQSAGIIGSLFFKNDSMKWYSMLFKPEFNPPGWVFGVVWPILYFLMGTSLYLILNAEDSPQKKEALKVFWIQLFLNAIWTPVFFGAKSLSGSFIIILALLIMIFVMLYKFYKVSKPAAYLNIPYWLWVSFATGLNLTIWQLN
jgi:tryptophan-rich sensory protein